MATFAIPNRPFATDTFAGLMTPDGIFEAALGRQLINAQLTSTGANASGAQIYIESVDDPGIVIDPATHNVAPSSSGASQRFAWEADFTHATPGKHLISFIVASGSQRQRILQRIFVTKMAFDPVTQSFSITAPEGTLRVDFKKMLGPKDACCCGGRSMIDARAALADALTTAGAEHAAAEEPASLLSYLSYDLRQRDRDFVLCMPQILPAEIDAAIVPTPPYTGQYGAIPFEDPWWKVLLLIVAFVLLIAAAIAEAVGGSGDLTAGAGGTQDAPYSGGSCCSPSADGGGTSGVAAVLLAAAAACATAAGLSDARDPFRKGQDNTKPSNASELTTAESLTATLEYHDDIVPGKPFKVGSKYKYTRTTSAKQYTHAANESHANVHLLDRYVITAPNVVRAYRRELWVVEAQFYEDKKTLYNGNQLYVGCYLIGPAGQFRTFGLQDSGVRPDKKANDGTFTGETFFTVEEGGLWKYFVLAQDVNTANPNMAPEEAAQIIGGMLLTNQLEITFHGGTCHLVPDGDVNVLA